MIFEGPGEETTGKKKTVCANLLLGDKRQTKTPSAFLLSFCDHIFYIYVYASFYDAF
jgi:hypothetical protein